MRVAFLVENYPELSQTFVVSEACALRRLGNDVRVESRFRAATPNPDAPADLPVRYVEDDSRRARLGALLWLAGTRPHRVVGDLLDRRRWRPEETPTSLRALAALAWRLQRAGVEHLHVHFATTVAVDALRLGRLLGLPCSVTAHAYEIYQRPRALAEKLCRASFTASGCDYTVRDLRALLPPERRNGVHRIVMGVDTATFRRRAPYPGGRTVVAVGRLVEKKGFAHLLDAVALLEPEDPLDRVLIVGDGPLRGALEEQRARLNLLHRVELAGALPPDGVRDLLEVADVLAMPCVVARDGDRDSMPVVVKEALAMEVPVVASDEVGLPEVVRPGWGRLVPPGDARALADALADVLRLPPEARAALGQAGRAHVIEACDVGREASRLADLMLAARV